MRIKFDAFELVEGNDIMLGKAGVYSIELYSRVDCGYRGEIYSSTGGFDIISDKKGLFRSFKGAEVVNYNDGFTIESLSGDEALRVEFESSLEDITLPSFVGAFSLSRFDGILRFPQSVVADSLRLASILILNLPKELYIDGDIMIDDCQSLTIIPEEWNVYGKAEFRYNPQLKAVKAKSFKSLDLEGCESLTSLPNGLTVKGDLNLSRCKSLTALPPNLTVGGSLLLSGSGVKDIHNTSKIGGIIN